MRGAGHLAEVFAVAGTVVLLIVGTPAGAAQGAPPPDPATGLYTDPEGFYTVPVPPGWTAEAPGRSVVGVDRTVDKQGKESSTNDL